MMNTLKHNSVQDTKHIDLDSKILSPGTKSTLLVQDLRPGFDEGSYTRIVHDSIRHYSAKSFQGFRVLVWCKLWNSSR